MEIFNPILEILIRLWDCIANDVNVIRHLKANLKALENALDQLKNVNEDVKRRVELEEESQMVRKNHVDSWLRKVEVAYKRVSDVLEKANQKPRMSCCCLGTCPNNCWSSYKLGEQVKKELKAVDELKNLGTSFVSVADIMPRGPVDERPLEETIGLSFEFQEVQRCIEDSRVKVIGIYGMGGVGKTTLLKKINNEFVKMNYGFDLVIWVVVSKQSDLKILQEAICEKLKLPEGTWRNKSEDEKAVQIFRILRMKKFVLMLDDIWKRVDLVRLGVPTSNDQTTSKVIFTTRYEDICGYMEADEKIKIKCLGREESLILFKKKVGTSTLNAHPSILKLAEAVAEECKGLPLALITLGRAMATKSDPRDWDRAITKLKKDPSRIMGMDDDVFRVLMFSYDNLHYDSVQSCFMYCCIFPEDHEILIDELLELWIGEEFLDEFDDINEARDQGREIIGILKAASLLESGKSDEYVKMHDVVRDMALWISSKAKTNRCLVLDHVSLLERYAVAPVVEAERISLWGGSITSVAKFPSCPNISTFVARNTAIRMLPCEFLQFITCLKVLDLSSNFHLAELPSEIGKLAEIEFLNLSNTRIRELPVELKNLSKMKYLILNAMYRLEVIPRQVISSFSLLRLFRISGNGNSASSAENNVLCGGTKYLLEELESLQHINDISITIFDSDSVRKFQDSRKIQSCLTSLCLEKCESLSSLKLPSSSLGRMRYLERLDIYYCQLQQLVVYSDSDTSPSPRFHSLRHVNVAYCDNLLDLTWLIYAPTIEILDISHCASMVEIVGGDGELQGDLSVFPRLKKLRMINVPNLQSIYRRTLSFPSMVEIHVGACLSLRRLPLDESSGKGSLKEIRGAMWWWLMLKWDDESLEALFRKYYVPEGPIW